MRDLVGVKGDECSCGRRETVRHCISCGSTRLYARQNRYHQCLNGEIKLVDNEFRCQGCGHLFIEEERQFCEAPPVGQTLAKLRVQRLAEASQRGEYLRPKDAKIAEIIDKVVEASRSTTATIDESSNESQNNSMQQSDPNFVPPNGLTRAEYDVADRAFRLEWAQKKLVGQDTGITVEEYVERRLKGELFQ
jgi:hypothetical protein